MPWTSKRALAPPLNIQGVFFEMKPAKRKPLFGIGINDYDGAMSIHGKNIPAYSAWKRIIERCSGRILDKNCYKSVVVCDEWKYFSNFKIWFDENYRPGCDIDKDLFKNGDRLIYSPDTCCFLPKEINSSISRINKQTPITHRYKKYEVYTTARSKRIHLGSFCTLNEAVAAYKMFREEHIKRLAQEYFDANKIERRVYDALMNYKVEVTD